VAVEQEIRAGERFAFGDNWRRFLDQLDDDRIATAEQSLADHLGDLHGKTFLDAGCGSGLFSLAARRLGATVTSFDYDPEAVGCVQELRSRFFPDDLDWVTMQGSVLDATFLNGLGAFDVVYSWGVLHHTGDMWNAIANVSTCVAPGGTLFIAIYNDQAGLSRVWRRVKESYNRGGRLRQSAIAGAFAGLSLARSGLSSARGYRVNRGMDWWRDIVDWVGGYPYEVATPGQVFAFMHERGFELNQLETVVGHGCNQYVFTKRA
jgi:2-polyprenyl-3-methyl-5-hydroxy-6-metoxy-1,4-benzoquinol methylase